MMRFLACLLLGSLALPTSAAETTVLGLVVRYTDTAWPGNAPAILDTLLFSSGGNSLRRYYTEGSGGSHLVAGNVHPEILELRQPRPPGTCQMPNLGLLGEAIRNAGMDLSRYTMIVAVVSSSEGGCNGGVQTALRFHDPDTQRHIPVAITWSLTDRFILHETGHVHRLGHAKTLTCRGDEVLIGDCHVREYGDFTDTMANGVIQTHGAPMRKILGWGRQIVHSKGTSTYTIGPAYTPGAIPNAIELRLPRAQAPGLRIFMPIALWIEYRTPNGFDAQVKEWPGIMNGALVKATGHWQYDVGGRSDSVHCHSGATCLLDMTPGDNTLLNAALPVGSTWTDAHTKTSIRVDARTQTTLTVTVSIP